MRGQHGRTGLDDEAYRKALRVMLKFLRQEGRITNRKLRLLTGLNCDQAVKCFERARSSGVLERRGQTSGTHYVLTEGSGVS